MIKMGRISIAIYSAIVSLILVAPTWLFFDMGAKLGESKYNNSCNATANVELVKIENLITKLKWIFLGLAAAFLTVSILLIVSLFIIPPLPSIPS